MNRVLLALNVVLVIAVGFLFYKVYQSREVVSTEQAEKTPEEQAEPASPVSRPQAAAATPPTGKLAYVNIDRLNEESLEIIDLVAETKRRKNQIEASVESLSMEYQRKVEEFQVSQKAGIAPQSDLEAKARDIQRIEQEAQNKQIQMDNLSMDINDKNMAFQKRVRDFLVKWNDGRYDFILSYSEAIPSMLLGNTSLEVTDEVISELNSEYKKAKPKKKS